MSNEQKAAKITLALAMAEASEKAVEAAVSLLEKGRNLMRASISIVDEAGGFTDDTDGEGRKSGEDLLESFEKSIEFLEEQFGPREGDADEMRGDVCMYLRDEGHPDLADEVGGWSDERIEDLMLDARARESGVTVVEFIAGQILNDAGA